MARESHDEKFLLAFDIDMQMRKASRQVTDFHKQLKKVVDAPKNFKKAEQKALSAFGADIRKARKGAKDLQTALAAAGKESTIAGRKARQQARDMQKYFDEVADASKGLQKTLVKHRYAIADIEEKIRKESNESEKAKHEEALKRAQARAKAEIKQSRAIYSAKRKDLDSGLKSSGATDSIRRSQTEMRKQAETFKDIQDEALKAGRSMEEATQLAVSAMRVGLADVAVDFSKEILEGVKDAAEGLKSKDFQGAAVGLGKGMAKGLLAGAKGIGRWGQANKGAGGIKGAAAGGVADIAKGLSGLMKSLGPTLGTLAKLGPLLSMASAAVVGIVKLMLDVEAAGKEINRELMEGASLMETFAASGYNANIGMNRLETTLQNIKDQTNDIGMNFSMGTNAKQHMAVINGLKQEGVTLEGLTQQLEDNKNAASATIREMTKYTDVTKMSIGYSRLFGVSLDEISSLQGEMMTELGMNVGDMKLEFARMADAAKDSGIAANKFFGIIRGISADMSLFGMRMKDVSKTMSVLGRTMSPRSAQKFMQFLSQGFKGKSMTDRLKTALIGGGSVTQAAKDDVAEKMKDLLGDIVRTGGAKTTAEAQSKLASGEITGEKREAYLRLQRRQKAMQGGGVLGTAAAMEDMGPAAVFEATKAAMMRFGGGKDLKSMTSLGMLATEQATGYSTEEQTQAMLFEQALEDHKKTLKDAIVKQSKGEKVDAKMQAKLERGGFKTLADVDKASTNALYRTMDESEEDQKKHADEQLKVAYESGKLSQSMVDKMDVVIDAIFNWLYKVMVNIWEVMEDIASSKLFGGDSETRKKGRLEVAVAKTKNRELADLAGKASSVDDFRHKLNYTTGAKDMAETAYNKKADPSKYNALVSAIEENLGNSAQAGDRIFDATRMAGVDTQKAVKARDAYSQGGSLTDALSKAGYSDDEASKFFDKIRLTLAPEEYAKAIADYQSKTGKSAAGANQTTADSSSSAVSQVDAKAGAPAAGPAAPKMLPPSSEETKQNERIISTNEDIHDALRGQGIKVDPQMFKSKQGKVINEEVLDAMRTALFEYALYTARDPSALIGRMQQSGFRAGDFASAYAGDAKNAAFLGQAPANAAGGVVTGIANGQAIVAAPGEGLASVGKGERIIPAGGGGGGNPIHLHVNGLGGNDLARYLEGKVVEGIYEYKRRERLR